SRREETHRSLHGRGRDHENLLHRAPYPSYNRMSRSPPARRTPRLMGGTMGRSKSFFFFQAEDGIRDFHVTGVQTCALPISARWKHLGIYGYPAELLRRFVRLRPAPLEQAESLEQLRALHHGLPIFVTTTSWKSVGVDTPSDLKIGRASCRKRELIAGRA